MPLALLLKRSFSAFDKGADQLNNWNQLVLLEQLLIGRARSAFLVHWFGPHLPLHGFNLRVVISNSEELKRRYQALRSSGSEETAGPNLFEPLAGMIGTLAGMAFSPSAGLGLSFVALKYVKKWYTTALAIFNLVTFGALVPMLGLVVGEGVGFPAAT